MADVIIIIKGKDDASDEIKAVITALNKLDSATKETGTAASKSNLNWASFATGLNQAIQVAERVFQALKQVYQMAEEGAALEYAETRFENLSESIGTTADALMVDLRNATDGMVSDSELVASAADFMALGLANSQEEVVRLSTVAGALGMDMNQLVLTLTNMTTMRFDALGVSVDGFDAKVKKLEESGLSASDAFKEAFLQQAEEQIERVGKVSDTSAGAFKRFGAQVKNVGDNFKMALANTLAPAVDKAATAMENAAEKQDVFRLAQELGIKTTRKVAVESQMGYGVVTESIVTVDKSVEELNAEIERYVHQLTFAKDSLNEIDPYINGMTESTEDAADAAALLAEKEAELERILQEATDAIDARGQALQGYFGAITDGARSYEDLQTELGEVNTKMLELEEIIRTGKGKMIDGKWVGVNQAKEALDELKGKAEEIAAKMHEVAAGIVWDMAMAAVDFKTITTGELTALFEMGIGLGVLTKESLQGVAGDVTALMSELGLGVDSQLTVIFNALLGLNDVEINIAIDIDDSVVRKYQPPPKYMTIYQKIAPIEEELAAGGVVQAAAAGMAGSGAYYVGEIGPEVFFPAVNGRVVSNSEAKASLRSAGGGGETIVVNINTPMNFASKTWVERELAPYITKAIRSERVRG